MTTIVELEQTKPYIASTRASLIDRKGIYLLGHCFDGTTSFRPGARFGPNAIREVSENLETYSPYLDKDLEDRAIFDLGNLPFSPGHLENTYKAFETFMDKSCGQSPKDVRLIYLGGEHSVSLAPIKYYLKHHPDLVLIHLDAHADLRDGYLGHPFSHASIIRRVLDYKSEKQTLIQYGIRSGTQDEFIYMRQHKTLRTSLESLCEDIQKIDTKRPIYLTLDLDFFDPSIFPGTGTPEAGGESFHSFIKIIKLLNEKFFVGADVVELAPMLDPSQISSCLASKVVREIILALS